VTSAVEIARQEWEESRRRVEASAGDRRRYREQLDQIAAVTDELRRRVGQTFTLAELADEYRRADGWVLDVLLGDEEEPAVGSPATVALAQGAAFHLYARGAVDYSP
jgi:hypothetical protein